jgi:hypothetical protein
VLARYLAKWTSAGPIQRHYLTGYAAEVAVDAELNRTFAIPQSGNWRIQCGFVARHGFVVGPPQVAELPSKIRNEIGRVKSYCSARNVMPSLT